MTHSFVEQFQIEIDGPHSRDVITDLDIMSAQVVAIERRLCSLSVLVVAVLYETPVLGAPVLQCNLPKRNKTEYLVG